MDRRTEIELRHALLGGRPPHPLALPSPETLLKHYLTDVRWLLDQLPAPQTHDHPCLFLYRE